MKNSFFKLSVLVIMILAVNGITVAQPHEQLNNYIVQFSQQKIYLHTDKQEYFAGDQLWYKVYLLDALSHHPDTDATTLYVELLHSSGELVSRQIIAMDEGYGYGDIPLADSLPEGNYLLRAYTEWMLNFNLDFIFKQALFVNNPEEKNYISRRTIRENRRYNRELEKMSDNYHIRFFPEGGKLIAGISSRVAFFAENVLGMGVSAEGSIVNEKGELIAEFSSGTDGRGVFEFLPEINSRYTALVKYEQGKTYQIPLGRINRVGATLRVDKEDEAFLISMHSNLVANASDKNFLLVHSRGVVQYYKEIGAAQLPFHQRIDASDLPAGIVVVSLFDSKGEAVAERLFFNFPAKEHPAMIATLDIASGSGEVQFDLPEGFADSLTTSIAVSGAREPFTVLKNNIKSHIFLDSDLVTPIFNPLYYLDYNSPERVDLLMLASGWERFDINKMDPQNYPEIKYPRIAGFPVFGRVDPTDQAKELGNLNFEVTIRTDDEEKHRATYTTREGNFRFEGFEFAGEFEAELSVIGLQGSVPAALEVFPNQIKMRAFTPDFHFRPLIRNRGNNWRRIKNPEIITERRITVIDDVLPYHHGKPDQIIYLSPTDVRYRNMRDVLTKGTPGISIQGNQILIRGANSLMLSNLPLLLVDGQDYSSFQFLNLSPMEVSHVEIFKGTSAAIFGIKGTNGVIYAHLRRSSVAQRHIINYILNGYYVPSAFNAEELSVNDRYLNNPDYIRTLFWQPWLKLDEYGRGQLKISVPEDYPYIRIILEGVDKDGNLIHATQTFGP